MSGIEKIEEIVQHFCRCLYDAMPQCEKLDRCRGLCGVGQPDPDVVHALGCFIQKHWDKIFSYKITYGDFRRTESLRFYLKDFADMLIDSCDPEDKEIWQKILDFGPLSIIDDGLIADVKITDNGELAYTRCGNSIKKIVDNLSGFLSAAESGEYNCFVADCVLTIKFMATETLKELKGFLKKPQLRQLQNLMSSLHIDIGQWC